MEPRSASESSSKNCWANHDQASVTPRFVKSARVTSGIFVPLGRLRDRDRGEIDWRYPATGRDNRPLIAFVIPIINNASVGMGVTTSNGRRIKCVNDDNRVAVNAKSKIHREGSY